MLDDLSYEADWFGYVEGFFIIIVIFLCGFYLQIRILKMK